MEKIHSDQAKLGKSINSLSQCDYIEASNALDESHLPDTLTTSLSHPIISFLMNIFKNSNSQRRKNPLLLADDKFSNIKCHQTRR